MYLGLNPLETKLVKKKEATLEEIVPQRLFEPQELRQKLFDIWLRERSVLYYNSHYEALDRYGGQIYWDWFNACLSSLRNSNSRDFKCFMFGSTWCHPDVKEKISPHAQRYIKWLFSDQSPWRSIINKYYPEDNNIDNYVIDSATGGKVSINSEDFHFNHGFFVEDDDIPTQAIISFYKAYRLVTEHPKLITWWARLQDEAGFDPYVAYNYATLICTNIDENKIYLIFVAGHSIWNNEYNWKELIENMRDSKFSHKFDSKRTWGKDRNYVDCDYLFSVGTTDPYDVAKQLRKLIPVKPIEQPKEGLRKSAFAPPRDPYDLTPEEVYKAIDQHLHLIGYKTTI